MHWQNPRNIGEVVSPSEIGYDNAPSNIYNQSTMSRMMEQLKLEEINKKNISYKKILGDIQKMSKEGIVREDL